MGVDGNGDPKEQSETGALSRSVVKLVRTAGSGLRRSAESALGTYTGEGNSKEVAGCLQELDAVNTALATRIYDLLDRDANLRDRVARSEKKIKWLIRGLVCLAAFVAVMLYMVLKRP
jgi:hypothetical protein